MSKVEFRKTVGFPLRTRRERRGEGKLLLAIEKKGFAGSRKEGRRQRLRGFHRMKKGGTVPDGVH